MTLAILVLFASLVCAGEPFMVKLYNFELFHPFGDASHASDIIYRVLWVVADEAVRH